MTATTSTASSRFLTPAELAATLNVSYSTIWTWLRDEKIKPTIADGRIIRFSVEDVIQQLKSTGNEAGE